MKLLFITNMPSYHQMELAEHLSKLLGVDNFRVAFLSPTSVNREEMGWSDTFHAPFVLRVWESDIQAREFKQWIDSADVVVQGRSPIALVRKRIYARKLTFAYQERFWKREVSFLRFVGRLAKIIRNYWSVNLSNYHLLAAGAYVSGDLNKLGCFLGRSWKFGYFINPISNTQPAPRNNPSSQQIELLWCGRFYGVKQPKKAIDILLQLVEQGVDARLTMVGDGELRLDTERYAASKNVASRILFVGWQSKAAIELRMQQADVFLMTSQRGEGWALVVNEAIRNACVVVCDAAVGSAPWLIQHGKTGFIYTSDNLESVLTDVANLNKSALGRMGKLAQQRHDGQWSAAVAAQRLVALSKMLLNDGISAEQSREDSYTEGPCTAA